jgi:hypothetical protein
MLTIPRDIGVGDWVGLTITPPNDGNEVFQKTEATGKWTGQLVVEQYHTYPPLPTNRIPIQNKSRSKIQHQWSNYPDDTACQGPWNNPSFHP